MKHAITFNSLYVTVSDMKKSVAFYSQLFGTEPEEVEERYTGIDISGVNFGLYNASYDNEMVVHGNTCVPVFEVPDLNKEHQRVKALSPHVTDIADHGDLRLFQFEDNDGNTLEFYQMK